MGRLAGCYVGSCLSAGANPDLGTVYQETALMLVAERGYVPVVRALAEGGASLDAADS